MCNKPNVPSVTLQTAVLMQVQEFANNNQQFSVHDVTRAVRSKVSDGELEIPEVEVDGASFRFDIPHTKVKSIFDELWRTGVFDPTFTLQRNFNGKYFDYVPSVNTSVPGISVAPTPAVTPSVNPATAILTSIATLTSIPNSLKPQSAPGVVAERTNSYLIHCSSKNFRPTLKQVQSAIKRGDISTGWTCAELKDLIETELGYTVIADEDYISEAQVVTD